MGCRAWLLGTFFFASCALSEPGLAPCTRDGRCLRGFECVAEQCVPCARDRCEESVVSLIGPGGGIACGPPEPLGHICLRIPNGAVSMPIAVEVTRTREHAMLLGIESLSPVYRVTPSLHLLDNAVITMPLSRSTGQLEDVEIFRAADPATGWTPLFGRAEYLSVTATTTALGFFTAARLPRKPDAGVEPDAGIDELPDRGFLPDAETIPPRDSGPLPDAGLAPDTGAAPDTGGAPGDNPIAGFGTPQQIPGGLALTGLSWDPAQAWLIFGDAQADVVRTLAPPALGTTVMRAMANRPAGVATDTFDRLIVGEDLTRAIARIEAGNRTILADSWMGQPLNGPLDVAVRASDGQIYFTDPGIAQPTRALGFNGLFRLGADGTGLSLEWQPAPDVLPGGLAFSADGRTLFVTDIRGSYVQAFDVAASGALSNGRRFATTERQPIGLAVDLRGNVYVGTQVGLQVFPATGGAAWGPTFGMGPIADLAFGGTDRRILYASVGGTLEAIPVAIAGF